MLQEFRDFITRGNLITLAVGFIMGIAFQAVVSSFVENVIMPIVAIPFGQPDFSSLTWEINDSVISWGSFVTAAVGFVLTALAVFIFIVKPYNSYEESRRAEEEEAQEEPGPSEIELLTEIRDSLQNR
jgi:large conductance mechanosensitive channel